MGPLFVLLSIWPTIYSKQDVYLFQYDRWQIYFILDTATALNLLERVRLTLQSSDETSSHSVSADLNLIISVLENPVFKGILTVQVREKIII